MILKLCKKHQEEEFYKVYINHDPGMTMPYFTTRSTEDAYAFEFGKIVKMSFEGKKLYGNGQLDRRFMILKKMDARGMSFPIPGQYTCILP